MSSAKPGRKPAKVDNDDPVPPDFRRVRAAETIGLAIIVLLILVYALVRYGRSIPWNAR